MPSGTSERERLASECKTQQHQTIPEDKALFEAASRIIKLEVNENTTPWIRLLDSCVLEACL
jgi:hypothetical protein